LNPPIRISTAMAWRPLP